MRSGRVQFSRYIQILFLVLSVSSHATKDATFVLSSLDSCVHIICLAPGLAFHVGSLVRQRTATSTQRTTSMSRWLVHR